MRREQMTINELTVNKCSLQGFGVNQGVGGEVFHLVTSKVGTNLYYEMLRKNGVNDQRIFATLASAYTNMASDQGDRLYVWPGDHIQTESLTWAKHDTSIIGAGSINQAYQPGTLPGGQVRISCATTSIGEIINFTGHSVTMYGIGTRNVFSAVDNYCDIRISGKNFYGKRISLRGGDGALQLSTVGAGVPLIVDTSVAGAGNGMLIEESVIGSSGNTKRTYGPGCVQFIGGAVAGFGMKFKNTRFSTRIEVATNNSVGLIQLLADYAVDRELEFEDCSFYNFTENLGTGPTYVFRDACTSTHQIVIKGNCSMNYGFTSWSDRAANVSVHVPQAVIAGGLGVIT